MRTCPPRVVRELYFGYLPLVKVRGFRDDLKGSLITKSIMTDSLNFRVVRDTWQKVPSEEALAVQPVMGLGVSTYYPLEGEEGPGPSEEQRPESGDGAVQQGDGADERGPG